MILLIDNYDSFTWNLYQYFCELGAEVVVRRNDEIALADIDALAPQKIVISPGRVPLRSLVSRWRRSAIMRANCRFWASAWVIRPLRRSLAPPLSVPRKSCTAKPLRSRTPVPAYSWG